MKQKILDTVLDLFFEKDKTKILLVFALILAFSLRLWAATTIQPSGDELVYGTHAINFISSGAVSNQNQSPVWFYLADIFYRIFGVTLVTGRLTSVLFSTLTVLLVFLLAKLIFDRQTAIVSAILLAISSYHIEYQIMEMDMTFTFFILLAAYLFLKNLKDKNIIPLSFFLFLGIAILSKPIPLTTIPGFFLAFIILIYYKKDHRKDIIKANIKNILIGLLILFVLLFPLISYNYLLYKEKGITDVMFARFLDKGMENFKAIENTLPTFSFGVFFFKGLKATLFNFFTKIDPIIFLLSIIGFFISFKKKYPYNIMLISIFIFTYIFLSGTSLLGNHFVFIPPLYAIFAALPLDWINKKIKLNYIIPIILLLIFIINIFILSPLIFSRSPTGQLREFANHNIDDNSLVIMDSRIYIGLTSWTMNDKHYIDASFLSELFDETKKLNSHEVPLNTFFIECVPDNCGGVSVDQKLNESMEQLILKFGEPIKTVYSGGGDGDPSLPYFKVYQATISQKPQILNLVDQTHMFFFYPVRWAIKDRIYDSYTPKGIIDNSVDIAAHLILYLAILIALLSPLFLLYLIYETFKKDKQIKSSDEDNSNSSGI